MEYLIDNVRSAKYLTKIGLTEGYWQIPFCSEIKLKSAFITPSDLYHFNVMSFGMKIVPATFQRMVEQVLSGLEIFASACIDEVIIHSETFESHLYI